MLTGIVVHTIIGGLVGGLVTISILTVMEFNKNRKKKKFLNSLKNTILNSEILKEMFENNESLIKIIKSNDKKIKENK